MKSYTAGYILSKHLAALKRQDKLSPDEQFFKKIWEKAYAYTLPLLNKKQKQIANSSSNNLLINTLIALNEWFLPGDHNHLLCRKYFIREWLLTYLAAGDVDHLVILGAGLDPLLYTLPTLPKKVTLVDHPDMIQDIKVLYKNLNIVNSSFYIKSTNLNNDSEINIFFDNICDKTSNILFITEGLLDYLNPGSSSLIISRISQIIENQQNHWLGTLFCLNEMTWLERFSFTKAIESVGESIKWLYSQQDFKKFLTHITKEKMVIYSHSELIKISDQKLEMNRNRMNGFYLFKC